ncbi:MAG: 3'-5' exoribonuclease [Clostridiales bacterium]|nr:3'-5' exoribonuclease [Clostridiales bacterium]
MTQEELTSKTSHGVGKYEYPKDKSFVFVDVETANGFNDRICAIGMILVKNGESQGYYTLINPQTHITLSYIHGITDADVVDAPTLEQFWQVMSPHIPNEFVFVAHNYCFDLNVMKKDLGRFGYRFTPQEVLDTMWVARDILYHFRTVKGDLTLNVLSERLDVQLNHHNAASDILATKEVLEKLLLMGNRQIEQFIRKTK